MTISHIYDVKNNESSSPPLLSIQGPTTNDTGLFPCIISQPVIKYNWLDSIETYN